MNSKNKDSRLKKLAGWVASIGTVAALGFSMTGGIFANAVDLGAVSVNTRASQEGCAIKIETVEQVEWKIPRTPIDLVILQDTSGSFENTIGRVQQALTTLTTPVDAEKYDENNPRLVFTGDTSTTDRVMVNTFQGIDGGRRYSTYYGNDFGHLEATVSQPVSAQYKYQPSALMTSIAQIQNAINAFRPDGGTPTVPAIDDTIKEYNRIKGDMANGRKTVFLLITDGVANGYRDPNDNRVYIDRSLERTYMLQQDWGTTQWPEAAQDYLARAKELTDKGAELKKTLGDNSKVVVGFWEDIDSFTTYTQYGKIYLNDLNSPAAGTRLRLSDNRSVQKVFHEALTNIASPDEVDENTGEKKTYYVNESDINVFSEKILKSVADALKKENVKGEFTVTPGYTVDSVQINGKTVVKNLTNKDTQIEGSVIQEGEKVTISVPESVFKSGKNSFDYKLKRTEEAANLNEADEEEPPANYTPPKIEREVGQLVGTFKVGGFESAPIGSTTPVSVQVTDLKYCYPRVTKDVKDQDSSNDKNGDNGTSGVIAQDPLLINEEDPSKTIKRPSYAASLTTESENFTYTVDYSMYNIPLEMKQNVMLTDQLNYHVQFINARVIDTSTGQEATGFQVSTQETTDALGNPTTTVVATVPTLPGVNNDTVKEGEYGGHKFKKYQLVITAKIKDQYSLENNAKEYYKMIQDNNGLGFANQAAIIWNGETSNITDKTAKIRRSNAVYVAPPVQTDIKKSVMQNPTDAGGAHLELPTREDDYYYSLESTWPGLFDTYGISDLLVPELVSLNEQGEDTIFVNGQESTVLKHYIKKESVQQPDGSIRDRVYFKLDKATLTATELSRINREITKLNRGNDGPAIIKLAIKAQIRENVVLAKYADNTGKIKVPNDATVTLNNESTTSNKVTVSPNSPAAYKRINKEKESLNTTVDTKTGLGEVFTYDISAALPKDINTLKQYYIRDELDERLELVNFSNSDIAAKMVDVDAEHFDVEVKDEEINGKTVKVVYARLKDESFTSVKADDVVHLVINARVKKDATGTIENTATVTYDGKTTPPTPPVFVTPPPKVTKSVEPAVKSRMAGAADGVAEGFYEAKINTSGEDIELAVWNDPYVYKVNTTIPKGATSFVISDELIPEMDMVNEITPTTPRSAVINADGVEVNIPAKQITVDTSGARHTIKVDLTADQIKQYAERTITLTFSAKFKAGADLTQYISAANGLPKAPNTAQIQVNNNPKVDSNTVTVTPPINKPEIKKTVDGKTHSDLDGRYQNILYTIKTKIPYNTKDFVVKDILEPVLQFKSELHEVTVKVGDKTYQGDELAKIVKLGSEEIDGLNHAVFTATFTNDQIAGNQDKDVVIEFLAQVRNEADLTKYRYVKENHSEKYGKDENHAEIPNEASYIINNKIIEKSTPVTVTPPPPTESKIDKKIEDVYSTEATKALVDHLNVENEKDYNYVIDVTLPSNIFEYKSWELVDTLDPRLALSKTQAPTVEPYHSDGTPLTDEDIAYVKEHFVVQVVDATAENGDATKKIVVTVPEGKMTTLHDKYQIRLKIPAYIKAGVTDREIPNEAVKRGVKPNNQVHEMKTPKVTVTPPQGEPSIDKKIETPETKELVTDLNIETVTPYNYIVTTDLPVDIAEYKKFVISDTLDDKLTALNTTDAKPTIAGDAAEFFTVVVEGNKVTATMKDIASERKKLTGDELTAYNAKVEKALAGKTVKLTIPAQIKAGETTPDIPNKAKIDYTNTVGADGTKETKPVTVTPPGTTPTIEKKIVDGDKLVDELNI
ncbi:isopeptide-forming domain-containing fimbrial protein, partial [Streptococcus gallolyticus]|nr:isopeptide-forming domain-containing fimbrial protein [Streptococcus gallolyticus]